MNKRGNLSFEELPNAVLDISDQLSEIREILLRLNPEVKEQVIDPFATKRLLDVNDLASLLRFSKGSIYNLINSGKIPYTKVGSRVYFESKTIDQWLREKEHKSYAQLIEEADSNLR